MPVEGMDRSGHRQRPPRARRVASIGSFVMAKGHRGADTGAEMHSAERSVALYPQRVVCTLSFLAWPFSFAMHGRSALSPCPAATDRLGESRCGIARALISVARSVKKEALGEEKISGARAPNERAETKILGARADEDEFPSLSFFFFAFSADANGRVSRALFVRIGTNSRSILRKRSV